MSNLWVWYADVVINAFCISCIGSYIGLQLFEQYRRTCKEVDVNKHMLPRALLALLSASCIGGITIWSSHCYLVSGVLPRTQSLQSSNLISNMRESFHSSSTSLHLKEISPIDARFDFRAFVSIVFSIPVIVIIQFIGAFRVKNFILDKREILDRYMDTTKSMTFTEIRHLPTKNQLIADHLKSNLGELVVCGMLLGAMLVSTQYCTLGGTQYYSNSVLCSSADFSNFEAVFAALTGIMCMWSMFKLLALYANKEALRIAISLSFGGAVTCLHCVHILSVRLGEVGAFEVLAARDVPDSIDTSSVNRLLISSVGLVLMAMFMLLLIDLRSGYTSLARIVREADRVMIEAHKRKPHEEFLQAYSKLRQFDGSEESIREFKKQSAHLPLFRPEFLDHLQRSMSGKGSSKGLVVNSSMFMFNNSIPVDGASDPGDIEFGDLDQEVFTARVEKGGDHDPLKVIRGLVRKGSGLSSASNSGRITPTDDEEFAKMFADARSMTAFAEEVSLALRQQSGMVVSIEESDDHVTIDMNSTPKPVVRGQPPAFIGRELPAAKVPQPQVSPPRMEARINRGSSDGIVGLDSFFQRQSTADSTFDDIDRYSVQLSQPSLSSKSSLSDLQESYSSSSGSLLLAATKFFLGAGSDAPSSYLGSDILHNLTVDPDDQPSRAEGGVESRSRARSRSSEMSLYDVHIRRIDTDSVAALQSST